MTSLQTGYQALLAYNENEAETPQESEIMIHVVPESGKSRWNHIEDLDSFFTRIYLYHQRHGLYCIVLHEICRLLEFVFAAWFVSYIYNCVNYQVLFKNAFPKRNMTLTDKIRLSDVVIPYGVCVSQFDALTIVFLFVGAICWILRLIKVIYQLFQYREIKLFYNTALKIPEEELENMTWHEVQRKLLEVQCEQQMCIHKRELSELDIYHRILRFKNYMVAMVNKNLLPIKFKLPLLGEVVFFSDGLKYNLEMILFWSPWAPFENSWHLKEDYKKAAKRQQLARELSKHILWIGLANFLLCPVILLWQVLYSLFSYVEAVRRQPSLLVSRTWSSYGKYYIRHFNELDHELNARLSRGHKAAKQYLSIFSSHTGTVLAQTGQFIAGTILAYLVILSVLDEDVLAVEHIITIITALSVCIAICRAFIPEESLVWCPEKLMTNILAHIHYMPDHWRGKAHTNKVREEFEQLFHYKAVHLLEDIISPIVTPIILCFYFRHRAIDIVDFFRNFTVEVIGVGDVCSFAQMDVRHHGSPRWMNEGHTEANQYQQTEDGKTELSLMHFTLTNPKWIPPEESSIYLNNLREQAARDIGRLHMMPEENALFYSLNSVSSLGGGYTDLVNSILNTNLDPGASHANLLAHSLVHSTFNPVFPRETVPVVVGSITNAEGPLHPMSAGLLGSLHPVRSEGHQSSLLQNPNTPNEVPLEFTAANMSISTLYMHGLHARQLRQSSTVPRIGHPSIIWQRPLQDMPGIMESPQEGIELEDRAEHQPLLLDTRIIRSS